MDGVETVFVYDGDQIIAEYDGSGVLQRKYVFGPGIDEPVLMQSGANKYYYHFDGLSSVTELTDNSGAVVEKYTYDVYGKTIIRNASDTVLTESEVGNRYGFTGRELDYETGLYFYRARQYSPEIGRFLQADPVGYYDCINLYQYCDSVGKPFPALGMNLYLYCSNSPQNYVDPLGLINFIIGGGFSAAGGAGGEASTGYVFNPGLGESIIDAGNFVSGGGSGGLNVSADLFAGFVLGKNEAMEGQTTNLNIAVGWLSLTIFEDPNTGKIIGGTLGAGPGATFIAGSLVVSYTKTVALRKSIDNLIEAIKEIQKDKTKSGKCQPQK